MNSYLSYEIQAAAFHRMTGIMAPGKDEPAACHGPSFDKRVDEWEEWQLRHRDIIRAFLWAIDQNILPKVEE